MGERERCPRCPVGARAALHTIFGAVICSSVVARAQTPPVPWRPASIESRERGAGGTSGSMSLPPFSSGTAPPSMNQVTGMPGAPPPITDPRLLGTDARLLGAEGRIIGADGRVIYPPPLEQPLDPDTYFVDRGDVLQARVWGEQNFDIPLPVDADGRMFVPRLGYIATHGKTLSVVSAEVQRLLHSRFSHLHSSVTLAVPRTFVVRVTGSVGQAGAGVPVNAWARASEVVQRAGGVTQVGSERHIELHRASGVVETVDLVRYPLFGDRSFDPVVRDGDWLHVPVATRQVTVHGAVNRPGSYELVRGTLAELVELAGGFSPEAAERFGLRVSSVVGDERKLQLVDFVRSEPEALTTELRHHDEVMVPTLDDGARVVVRGALGGPDANQRLGDGTLPPHEALVALPFAEGQTAKGAILKAGGLAPWADLNNAFVEHTSVTTQPSGAAKNDKAAAATKAPARVPLDLRAIFMHDDDTRDVKLQPGDTIFVPSGRGDVLVGGHVMKPGNYGYSLHLVGADYLALAGGETRDGTLSGATVVSPDGTSKSFEDRMLLRPGDSIVVPGKTLTAAEWVSISLGLISVGISAAFLAWNIGHN